ncbi:hypothetical protein [Pantoea sp. 18069]|uniref:hypothetical protein n=1 Tax=Pantoea sp. 18069 TaxID=2681415 RepID=UPI00135B88E1|nr:hypothetical protein [Pantoea sp. 18069]
MPLPLSPFLRCSAAAALLWLAGSAFAQTTPCMAATDASHQTLLGHWNAEFTPAAGAPPIPFTSARLELTPHPELAASVRGRLQRAGSEALLAGDVDQGDFTLEESVNGTNISATWIGQVVSDSCGKEIRGTWTQENPPLALSFVLRKQPGE